jgi:acetyl esterase/lipase
MSPEFAALRQMLRDSPLPRDLTELRAAYEAMGVQFPLPAGVVPVRRSLGGRPCEWIEPASGAQPSRVILYLHGGGYCIGSPASHRHMGPEMAALTGAATALLDYRLAPEHLFPAAIEDAVSAYRELLESYDANTIALAGDSAGGGLVMALVADLARLGLPQPACAYCMSPWLDLNCESETIALKAAEDPLASGELLKEMAARYLGPASPSHVLASPILADLSKAPPILIQVGTAEVLLGDALALTRDLGYAGRSVQLDIWKDMIHVWPWFFPNLPEGREALNRGCEFIATHFNNQ